MKIKIYLAVLTCVLGTLALTGCNQDSSTSTASTNSMPSTNMIPSTNAIPSIPSTNH